MKAPDRTLSDRNQALLDRFAAALPDTSRKQLVARAGAFLYWLEDRPLDTEQVRRFLDKMKRDTYADGSLRFTWSVLRRLFVVNEVVWPFRRGDAPVVREMHEYAPPLHPHSVEAMVNVVLGRVPPAGGVQLRDQHRTFLCLSTIWGLRRVEMVGMQPAFLDVKAKLLFVETAKHGRQRWHMVPDHVMPHLEGWGFREPMSRSGVSLLFSDLKAAIGFTGTPAMEVGWHSIRRTLSTLLQDNGLSQSAVEQFLRWKRSTNSMVSRYHSHAWVGHEGVERTLAAQDRAGDEVVLAKHPFLNLWK